jgi:hypothetical protein
MSSAYRAGSQGEVNFLNDVLSALPGEHQSLLGTDNVSVFDLLSKNQPFSDKLDKLRTCRTQLISVKRGTPEYLAIVTEALNITSEIITENWDAFPISVKKNLKEKLSRDSLFKNALSSPSRIILSIIKSFSLVPMIFSRKPETLELNKSYQKSISNILSLVSEIQMHGHPLKKEELNGNSAERDLELPSQGKMWKEELNKYEQMDRDINEAEYLTDEEAEAYERVMKRLGI